MNENYSETAKTICFKCKASNKPLFFHRLLKEWLCMDCNENVGQQVDNWVTDLKGKITHG